VNLFFTFHVSRITFDFICFGDGFCEIEASHEPSPTVFNRSDVIRRFSSMPSPIAPTDLARLIDHTLLRAEATAADIEKLCAEAREHHFYSVCVNGSRVEQASYLLEDTDVKIVCVAGFPLGAASGDVKRFEAEAAIDDGAHEIDLVLNIGRLKDGDDKFVLRELRDVVEAADERPVKVILETCLLTRDEKIRACHLAVESGAQFVKTSTGLSSGGATVEDVKLLRETVGPKFGVKASGGIRDTRTALAMIEAGATRIGASASVAIVQGLLARKAGS
jgi:deoxyribose-phosphate aldolase